MSSRLNFIRGIIDAASNADSAEGGSEAASDSGYLTGSRDAAGSSNPSLLDASQSVSRGRGRARLLSVFADLQKPPSSGEVLEQPRLNPTHIGRGRFVQVLLDHATEQASRASEAPTVSEVANKLEQASIEEKKVTLQAGEKTEKNLVSSPVVSQASSVQMMEPMVRTGTSGSQTTLLPNFMELRCAPDRGIFLYTIDFEPVMDAKGERYRCVDSNPQIFGKTWTFNGDILMLPVALPEKRMVVKTKRPLDGSDVTMTVTFRAKKRLSENVMFYNVLFRRIMNFLQLSEIGRKHFDPTQARIVPQHKLEVWPGFVTAVNEFEGGLMLNLDVTHRVLMQTTVYDHIKMTSVASPGQFRENLLKSLLGVVVFTRYNKKTYRVDDIDFNANPLSTFRCGDRDVTYVEYYRKQYDIDIHDHGQPLLIHRSERRIAGQTKPQEMIVCLVPEICHLTGLTDQMRSDYHVMRDIATYTRVSPNQRMAAMEKFCQNVNSNEKARTLLASWGLELMPRATPVVGRTLPHESVHFGNNVVTSAGPLADFNNQITSNKMLEVVHIRHWLLVHTNRDAQAAKVFIDCVHRNSRLLGIEISRPQTEVLQQDSTQLYVQLLRTRVLPETQIVVIICPTSRDDRYAAIKRVCCAEVPVPTQVINARTLLNDKKARSIVLKIVLQMNCKLGGTLWGVHIPLRDTMICGIDTYHEAKRASASVAAIVGSLDAAFTHWYSRATVQSCKEEFLNGLCVSFEKMLHAYKKRNCQLPARIIIFRDGVGDSQLVMCEEYEVPQLKAACQLVQPGYDPKFTFIVVQKRIITRLFSMNGGGSSGEGPLGNPPPGTVLDHTVTRRYHYDFFLVSQSVRQGTVSPTHYIVLRDDSAFAPDILQRLSYKMCYMYYNWPGSVRVPACCQYAHKLAYLVGQSVKRMPAEALCDKLFYL